MRLPLAIIALLVTGVPAPAGDDAIEAKVLAAGGTVTRNPIFKLGRPIVAVTFNSLSRGKKVDELLPALVACESLDTLQLDFSDVTDAGLTALRYSSVRVLSLEDTSVTDDAFFSVAHLRNLRELSAGLRNSFIDITHYDKNPGGRKCEPLTDAALKQLAGHRRLECIALDGASITDDGLRHLTGMPNLRSIYLNSSEPISDAALETLGRIRTLEEIDVNSARFTDGGLKHLAGLPRLRTLRLSGCSQLTEVGLKELARHTGLRKLVLSDTKIAEHLALLAPFAELETLDLSNTPVTDAGLPALAKLTTLVNLSLRKTAVTDAGIPCLAKLELLRKLDLVDTAVTAAGRAALRKLLPKCVVLPAS